MPEILDQGYLALPSTSERAPAVMVIPAWWGLNPFFKQLCDRLAEEGFVAFAPDLYGGKVAETIPQAEEFSNALDKTAAVKQLHETIEALRHHSRTNGQPISIVGFSMGAFRGLALLTEVPDQIAALVAFYGSYNDEFPKAQTAVLGHFAEVDDYEPPEEMEGTEKALKDAGIDTTFYTYPGTGHWFFESNQPQAYNAEAAALAWERTLEFLKTHL
jgi:carboxymethylenebutenolidase